MSAALDKAIAFLKAYAMDYTDIDIDTTVALFLEEMEKGLSEQPGSLQMIPTYIEIHDRIPVNEPVIVLDAGGTNFRVAVVSFDKEKQPRIEQQTQFSMPGIGKEISRKEFFRTIVSYMEKVADAGDKIGFCFSYPTEILPSKDGKVLHFSKEIKVRDVEGHLIGENLAAALTAHGFSGKKRIVLLNDTVTTLLAGTSLLEHKSYGSYVGFILGTGTNCCYIEKNRNIKKTPGLDPEGSQIINVESGGFNRIACGKLDERFDQGTKIPSRFPFEKMHSGAYFGPLCKVVLKTAADDKLFSARTGEALSALGEFDTKDVSDFLHLPCGDNMLAGAAANEDDRGLLYLVLERMVERSAKLAAIALSAAVLKSGAGEDPCRPVCISAEGSTFFGMKNLKFGTKYYLKEYLREKKRRHTEIVSIKNATIIGAALAGLTN
ncbi:MAG TPA: hexokinase [Spirochaetia bacterium]|nr:hexokinase [Spirochaetia bacterium]